MSPTVCSAAVCVVGSTGVLHLQATSKANGDIKTMLITMKLEMKTTICKQSILKTHDGQEIERGAHMNVTKEGEKLIL